jgi:hypothetical protein
LGADVLHLTLWFPVPSILLQMTNFPSF